MNTNRSPTLLPFLLLVTSAASLHPHLPLWLAFGCTDGSTRILHLGFEVGWTAMKQKVMVQFEGPGDCSHSMPFLILSHVKSSQEILPGKSDHFRVVKCPNPMAVAQVLFTNMVASFSTIESQALAVNQSGESDPQKMQDNYAKTKETTAPQHRFADLPVIFRFLKMGVPQIHPSHSTILVAHIVLLWGSHDLTPSIQ